MTDLQRLTEQLGERLERSVAIDNPQMQLQAYSPHFGAVDEQRLASILHRQAHPEAIEWAMEHGVQHADDWVRLPASPERGMLNRICVPVRHDGVLMGYIWLIDADESINAEELDLAREAAHRAADIMHRDGLIANLRTARERELLRDLIDDNGAVRDQAMSGLAEESLFDVHRPVQAVVLDTSADVDVHDRVEITEVALIRIRQRLPERRSLHLTRPDHGLLVLTPDEHTRTADVASRLYREYRRLIGDTETPVRAGIGTLCDVVTDVRTSYRRARAATHVGGILGLRENVTWAELGIYRLLSVLPVDEIVADVLHPGVIRLAAHPDGEQLLHTLEVFLDAAGDVASASAQLYLHRTTLYNRLSKIERVGALDLKRGAERLDLHLSIKLARLRGVHPTPAADVVNIP